ncbi:hypothetical protein Tco_0672974 [Tanacetum coccineum]
MVENGYKGYTNSRFDGRIEWVRSGRLYPFKVDGQIINLQNAEKWEKLLDVDDQSDLFSFKKTLLNTKVEDDNYGRGSNPQGSPFDTYFENDTSEKEGLDQIDEFSGSMWCLLKSDLKLVSYGIQNEDVLAKLEELIGTQGGKRRPILGLGINGENGFIVVFILSSEVDAGCPLSNSGSLEVNLQRSMRSSGSWEWHFRLYAGLRVWCDGDKFKNSFPRAHPERGLELTKVEELAKVIIPVIRALLPKGDLSLGGFDMFQQSDHRSLGGKARTPYY